MLRAILRVVLARWNLRHLGPLRVVHFVSLDQTAHTSRDITDRPTLCGTHVSDVGDATVQPDIVSCWGCALGIERDRERWTPVRRRNATTEHGMTVCHTCGGVDGYPPGCRCQP